MNKKALIIGIILIACIISGIYLFLSQPPEYMNITMNGITFEVPKSNVSVTNQTEHYSIYNDTEGGVDIFVFDSEDSQLKDISEMMSFAAVRDSFQIGAQLQKESNFEYNYSDTMKVYTYLTNYTHKNVFIVTKNKEDMEHILSKIDASSINESVVDNETNNTTENKNVSSKTKTNTVKSNTSEKSEYGDYIDDKWVSMSEEEYAQRYPVLYHEDSLSKGKYDKYHPEMYDADNGYD